MFMRACWIVMLWVAVAAAAMAASDFGKALHDADLIRTSDPAKFRRAVEDLDKRAGTAMREERQYLRLLDAYSMILAGEFDGSIRELTVLLAQGPDADLKVRAGALLVNVYAMTRDFAEGLRTLDDLLSVVDSAKDKDARQQGLLAATLIYNQVGQYHLGQQYADRVLADAPGERFLCMASNMRLESLQGQGKALADEAYVEAATRCQEIGEPIAANLVRSYLARKWFDEGKVEAAIGLLAGHLDEVHATGYLYLISEFNALLAKFRLSRGDVALAEYNAKVAIEHQDGFQTSLPLSVAYMVLYSIAQKRGDAAAALVYYRRYAEADKAYLNETKAREIAYQIVQSETKAQAQQIELLNRENQLLQLQHGISVQKAQTSRLLILLLVVLVGTVSYWALKTKRMQMSLRRMAETDALTSVCNRHYFNQQSVQTLAHAARAGEDVALVMFDLDHFKSINDRFGHDTGDWVLKRVSDHCRTFCRRVDHFGRIGGEEFAILLSGCDLRGARRVAEDCRVRIASIDSQASGHKFLITASFGVTASSLSGYDLAKLLSHADKALYRSKRQGRNRVSTFDGDVQPWTQLQVVAIESLSTPGGPPAPEEAPDHRPFQNLIS